MKLLYWIVTAFLVVALGQILAFLFKVRPDFDLFIADYLVAETNPTNFIYKPWTIITYMFLHADFIHILFNMVMFYFSGRLLEQSLGGKRLLFVFFASGIVGFLVQFGAYNIFPVFDGQNSLVIGASGAVTGVFIALATLSPNLEVSFFGLLRLKIIWLALIFILIDLLGIQARDNTAHFVHLGGALFGFLYATSYRKGTDWYQKLNFQNIGNPFKRKPKIRVAHSSNTRAEKASDDHYNAKKVDRQKKIDQILDKIKDSGYDSLSKSEKDYLFKESKNM